MLKDCRATGLEMECRTAECGWKEARLQLTYLPPFLLFLEVALHVGSHCFCV